MDHRDARRGALFLAAEVRGQRPWDGRRARLPGSDAWAAVRRDAAADGRRALPQKPDVDAGKSAGRELDGPVSGDLQLDVPVQLTATMRWPLAVSALYKWAAGRSAA